MNPPLLMPMKISKVKFQLKRRRKKNKKDKKDTSTENGNDHPSNAGEQNNENLEAIVDVPEHTEKKSKLKMKRRLEDDHKYISSMLAGIAMPKRQKSLEDEDEEVNEGEETLEEKEKRIKPGNTSRAHSNQELRERLKAKLEEFKGKKLSTNESKQQKKMKRKLQSIEKKKLADNELKQKLMSIGKNAGNLQKVLNKDVQSMGAKLSKPGVKTENGVVFSKFDFQDLGAKETKKNLDPQAALVKIKKNKEKIKLWEEKGKIEKAKSIENNIAWENALGKAQGEKIKDDETLLKKSIKKQKQIKKSSKKKREARAENVKSKETAFVEKRESNMLKRKKEKHAKKMKKLEAKRKQIKKSSKKK